MDKPNQPDPTRWARGGSQSDLRRHNERAVLSTVERHPGLFNAELARRTGLAAQTISVILKSLEDQKLITRGPVLRGRRGQPATPIFLNPRGAQGLGVDIGLRRTTLVRTDFAGVVTDVQTWRHPYPDPATVIARIASWARALVETGRPARLGSVRLGVAKPHGLFSAHQLGDVPADCVAQWARIDLQSELESQLQMPVLVVDGGAAASQAQARDKDHPANFAYLHLGPSLVSGLVLDGQVHFGQQARTPDFGTIWVGDTKGNRVRAADVMSVHALETFLATKGMTLPGGLDAESAIDEHTDVVRAWITQTSPMLAHLVSTIEAVIALGAILIDGDMPSALLDALVAATRRTLRQETTAPDHLPTLYCGRLGDKAVALGAARAPLQRAYFSASERGEP